MPFAIEALAALMVIVLRAAAVTVSVIEFDAIPFWDALIALVPITSPLANPLALMVATAAFDEFQLAEFVIS